MRIGMVLETSFPPDIRVDKEMRILQEDGHEVLLLCGHDDNKPDEERYGKSRIIRFRAETNKIRNRLNLLTYWLTTRKSPWEKAITDFVQENQIEALHVHDLPLVLTALPVARRFKIPLVFDMHEVYPVMVREHSRMDGDKRSLSYSKVLSYLFSFRWWERVEERSVEHADRVIVVIEEAKERLVRMGFAATKIFVVLNAEDIDQFVNLPHEPVYEPELSDKFLIGYVGGIDNTNRGLDNLVRAWPLLLKTIPSAHLVIVGDGRLRSSIEKLVDELNLRQSVTITGWVPFEKVPSYIRPLGLAVVPHIINEHTNHTIPHKLFQYIAMGKLVVASDIKPIRRILEDTGAGNIVSDWSPEGFAEALTRAHAALRAGKHDPERQRTLLKDKYGFEAVSEPLKKLYREL